MDKKYITKVIAACLLGDGSVRIKKSCTNANFRLAQIEDHKDHVDFIKNVISQVTKVSTWVKTNFAQGSGKNPKPQIWIESNVHPIFTNFYEKMYPNNHKVVDPHYLTFLDAEFLAIWYMQDGTCGVSDTKHGKYGQIKLATHGFSYGDNHCLRAALKEKLDLDWNVSGHRQNNKQYYFLSLRSTDTAKFRNMVLPYMQESFMYKIPVMVGSRLVRDEDMI